MRRKETADVTTNRLQAFLDKASAAPATVPQAVAPKNDTTGDVGTKRTILVGAHLPPVYHKQLRLIAAEEDTQVNTLIREALDLLFLKKGKARIKN